MVYRRERWRACARPASSGWPRQARAARPGRGGGAARFGAPARAEGCCASGASRPRVSVVYARRAGLSTLEWGRDPHGSRCRLRAGAGARAGGWRSRSCARFERGGVNGVAALAEELTEGVRALLWLTGASRPEQLAERPRVGHRLRAWLEVDDGEIAEMLAPMPRIPEPVPAQCSVEPAGLRSPRLPARNLRAGARRRPRSASSARRSTLFAERGYERASISAIAGHARVSRRRIRHFGDKESLVRETSAGCSCRLR